MNSTMSRSQRLNMYKTAPSDLVATMESFVQQCSGFADVLRDPMSLYTKDIEPVVTKMAMESAENSGLQTFGDSAYEDGAVVYLESMTEDDDEVSEAVGMSDLHRGNLQRLLENSSTEMRIANQRGIGELTPYDAFLPFAIIRTYLPLVGKDLVPYIVPKQHFIRIKTQDKYIVTKDGKRHLEPDVYNDYEATAEILASAKGKRITDAWYPENAATEVTVTDPDAADAPAYDFTETTNGVTKYYKIDNSKTFRVNEFDLLGESGGAREIGDALDIDVCIDGARALVTNSAGTSYMVEVTNLQMFLDTTAISPKNSLGGVVRFPVKDATGKIESYAEDTIMATYDEYSSRISVVSLTGLVKQVRFGGHLSNKNNMEYLTFRDEYDAWQHPIPEGYRANLPITVEDMRLYNETASIDIIAYGINRMTEMYNNLEDTSVITSIANETEKWRGVTEHPFKHFKGRVFVTHEVDLTYEQNNPYMKRLEFMQDKVSNELNAVIREVRRVCQNEPFRLVAYCHPNIASLFVGNNVDWHINSGDSIMGGIRSDYNMGITTQDGNVIRLITSMKFKEADGVRGLVFPVNEQNFLTWKHFKRALYFDRDHRISQMSNNPNVMCVATFHTQSYIPLSFQLKLKNYDNLTDLDDAE